MPLVPYPPTPIFRARFVALSLERGTTLFDATREGDAVGESREFISDSSRGWSFTVRKGRVFSNRTDDAFAPFVPFDPVAVARDGIVFRRPGSKGRSEYRLARELGSSIWLGGRSAQPKRHRCVTASRSEIIPMRREWWPPEAETSPSARVEWISLRRTPLGASVKVGTVEGSEPMPEGENIPPAAMGFDLRLYGAMARVDGHLSTLADRTVGYRGPAFGEVLFVSPESWLVVTVGRSGLAWLEPIAR